MEQHNGVNKFAHLRQQAEAIVEKQPRDWSNYSLQELQRLVYELKVHQVELELQNEALSQAQSEWELAQKKYAELYDSAPVGYVTLDEAGLILEANLTLAEILGSHRATLIGQLLLHFVAPEDRDNYCFYQQRLSKAAALLRTEIRLLRSDGSHFYGRLHGRRFIQPGEARIQQYRIIISDITEWVQAEQARQGAHTFISAVLDTAGALILVMDQQGRIVCFNRACEQLTGYSFEEVRGQPLWDLLLLPEERAPVQAIFEQLRTGKFPNEFKNHWLARDGSRHLISWSNTALPDTEGRVQYIIGIGIDITQHKAAEEAYHTLVDHSLQGLAIFEGVDQGFRLVFANPGLSRIGGYSTPELMSMTPDQLKALIHPEDRDWVWKQAINNLTRGVASPRLEFRFIDKAGLVRWAESYVNRIEYRGKPAIQIAFIDITERKQAEETLRESEARLDGIISTATDAIITLEADQQIILFNAAAEQMFGYKASEVIGRPLDLLLPERFRTKHARHVDYFGKIGVTARSMGKQDTLYGRRANGQEFPIEVMISQVEVAGRKFYTAIVRDITVRRQTESELAHLLETVSEQREQLRAVTGQLAEAQEAERKALARELHDQVGQKLTALNLNLNALRTRLVKTSTTPEPLMAVLEQSLKLVEETTERIQNVMSDLRPPMLDDYGLLSALRWYGAEVAAQANFEVVVQGEEPDPRLAAPVEHALFRITQEALTNVVKHAQATQVTITLTEGKGRVRLVIADNGRGFRLSRPKPGERHGWGLLTMAERAEAVGGRFQIRSRPGQGTQVIVKVAR